MLVNDREHAGLHLRSHVPVARDDRAAVVLPALAGVVPQQLGRFLEKGVGPMTALVNRTGTDPLVTVTRDVREP